MYSLVESVRQRVKGIHEYGSSDIREIDELHGVIEKLTDAQKEAEERLLEEKERYKIAVETSNDMFFTYRKKDGILEIVNSEGFDGIWDCRNHPEYLRTVSYTHLENFWNPSSVYTPALNNRKVVDESRDTIAKSLGTTPENIYFTAGGSESDNWALTCTAEAYQNKGKHILSLIHILERR